MGDAKVKQIDGRMYFTCSDTEMVILRNCYMREVGKLILLNIN